MKMSTTESSHTSSKETTKDSNTSLSTSLNHSDNNKKSKNSKNSGLKKCFSALVDRKQVNLELEVLMLMLRKELDICFDTLEPTLVNMLPYLLVYYIKNWPGWQKSADYYMGKLTFKVWYDKFLKFITFKLNEAINVHYAEVMTEYQQEKSTETRKKYMLKKITDHSTQTDNLGLKVMAPFSIEITAKPILLNTIVFTDTPNGDIILKQHAVLEWDKKIMDVITLKQLISWPHVGVHMISPVFAFTRRNLHEFRRHVSIVGTPLPPTSSEFVEEIKILNPQMPRTAFTIGYLRQMSKEYLQALRTVYSSQPVINAFETVIDEFLLDVEELDICRNGQASIANNTSVLFNIGKCTYFRNKKLSKGTASRHDIGYTEVIIPKMETALCLLQAEEDLQSYLNHLKNFNPETSLTTGKFAPPQISFSCSYCQKNFDNGGQIANHLKEEHKMEQPMLCTHCKQPFPAIDLSNTRWKHNCVSNAKK